MTCRVAFYLEAFDDIFDAGVLLLVPLNQDLCKDALVPTRVVGREEGQQSQRDIDNDVHDLAYLFFGQDVVSNLRVDAVSVAAVARLRTENTVPRFIHLICTDPQRSRPQQPLTQEQLADGFGLDVGAALREHDQSDQSWNKLVSSATLLACLVHDDELGVESEPAFISSRKVGLQEFAIGENRAKVNLGDLAIQAVNNALVFEDLLQLRARNVMQVQTLLLPDHVRLFRRKCEPPA